MMRVVDTERMRVLLERLEQHWRRVDAPISRFLNPGLDESSIDAATTPLGLRLPVPAACSEGVSKAAATGSGVRREGTGRLLAQ